MKQNKTQTSSDLIKKNDIGRSMVEMLGTLAVMGVLAVGGIMGYRYAMDKYRANQTINDVNLRAHTIELQLLRGIDVSLNEFDTTSTVGYLFEAPVVETDVTTGEKVAKLSIVGLEKSVCQIVKDGMPNYEVIVNEDTAENTDCADLETGNKVTFILTEDNIKEENNPEEETEPVGCTTNEDCTDVAGKPLCGDDGICQACPHGQIWDENAKICVCPEGKRWNAETNACDPNLTCAQAMEKAGYSGYTVDGNTIKLTGELLIENGKTLDLNGCSLSCEHVEVTDGSLYSDTITVSSDRDGIHITSGKILAKKIITTGRYGEVRLHGGSVVCGEIKTTLVMILDSGFVQANTIEGGVNVYNRLVVTGLVNCLDVGSFYVSSGATASAGSIISNTYVIEIAGEVEVRGSIDANTIYVINGGSLSAGNVNALSYWCTKDSNCSPEPYEWRENAHSVDSGYSGSY